MNTNSDYVVNNDKPLECVLYANIRIEDCIRIARKYFESGRPLFSEKC